MRCHKITNFTPKGFPTFTFIKIFSPLVSVISSPCRRPASTPTKANPSSNGSSSNKGNTRRKAEDKMAMIFVAIVTGFMVCNAPRIFLNFHEIYVLETAKECQDNGFE